jgi:hypothetical protein
MRRDRMPAFGRWSTMTCRRRSSSATRNIRDIDDDRPASFTSAISVFSRQPFRQPPRSFASFQRLGAIAGTPLPRRSVAGASEYNDGTFGVPL